MLAFLHVDSFHFQQGMKNGTNGSDLLKFKAGIHVRKNFESNRCQLLLMSELFAILIT